MEILTISNVFTEQWNQKLSWPDSGIIQTIWPEIQALSFHIISSYR